MSKSFAAPRTIRRIAARRVFHSTNGKSVVLTIGVPQPVAGSDWGCALQITGLNTGWRRPRYVFGVDGLQALELAIKRRGRRARISEARPGLAWRERRLGECRSSCLTSPSRTRDDSTRLWNAKTTKFSRRAERARKAKRAMAEGPKSGEPVLTRLTVGFIRFVVAQRHPDSGVEDGTFRLAYQLRDSVHVEASDRGILAEHLTWFEKNLETPPRFNRTKSKGFYRRNTRGIAWFKDTATEHLAAHAQGQCCPGAVWTSGQDGRGVAGWIHDSRGCVSGDRRTVLGHSDRLIGELWVSFGSDSSRISRAQILS